MNLIEDLHCFLTGDLTACKAFFHGALSVIRFALIVMLAGSNDTVSAARMLCYDHLIIDPFDNNVSSGLVGDEQMVITHVGMYIVRFKKSQCLID